MNKLTSLILFITLLSYTLSSDNTCSCPSSAPAPQTIIDSFSSLASSVNDVVIDGVNYGKLLHAGNLLLLEKAVSCPRGVSSLNAACPKGFRLPTKEEYESMLETLGDNAYETLKDIFPGGKVYMTSTKTYPDNTNGADGNAWAFYGLGLSGSTYKITVLNTFFDGTYMFARCMMKTDELKLNVLGLTHDLVVDEARTVTLDTAPFAGFVWRFENEVYTENEINVKVNKKGCRLLEVWGNLLNGQQVYYCQVVNANVKMGSDVDASFNLDKVSVLTKTWSASRSTAIHFDRGVAPVAPKSDGGYYLAFVDQNTQYCKVVDFDNNDNVLKEYTLSEKAYPLDIVETDNGLSIFFRAVSDVNYSYLVVYDKSLNQLSKTTIMNNGENGLERNDSLVFYLSSGTACYGSNYMYHTHNGKLAYGKNRVNLIFAHYNYFGAEYGGHTGDSYYSFDENGDVNKAKYAWTWETSHSCIQSHIYDGTYFVTAALGDYYPQAININVVDQNSGSGNVISFAANQNLCGTITGNGKGSSMGKLGGVLDLGSQKYAVVYTVKDSGSENGLFLVTFNYNGQINLVGKYKVLSEVGKVKSLRAAKYGSRILILVVENQEDFGTGYPSYYLNYQETLSYLLVDTEGKVVSGPYTAASLQAPLNEDVRYLKDGSLRWGYVDDKNVLRVVKVEAPKK